MNTIRHKIQVLTFVLIALSVWSPSTSHAQDDNFFKWGIGANSRIMFGEQTKNGIGVTVNLGCFEQYVNLNTGVNFNLVGPRTKYVEDGYTPSDNEKSQPYLDGDIHWGMKYQQLSIPVELHCNISPEEEGGIYVGLGVIYNLNMNGSLYTTKGEKANIKLNDALNTSNLTARVIVGWNFEWGGNLIKYFDLGAFYDFDITSPVYPCSEVDDLFQYVGPIEYQWGRDRSLGMVLRVYL